MEPSPVLTTVASPAKSRRAAPPRPPDARYRQVQAFAQLVDQDFRSQKTVRDYAERLRVTPNHLNALCRRLLNQTASGLLHARVVAEAQLLLRQSDASVAAVAQALGFADTSYFGRYFKKYVRQTPTAFREAGPR